MAPHWLNDLVMLARLARDFRPFLRTPVTAAEAVETVQRRLATREERFLRMAQQAIYGHPRSPYLQLLKAAGCEFGDLKALVSKEGLEKALSRLVDAGVYFTFDEFKGRKEAVRGSRRFIFAENDFDNPLLFPHFEARSGGTRSPGTLVKIELAYITELAINTALALHAHHLTESKQAIWLFHGSSPVLIYAKLGRAPVAWFYSFKRLPFKTHAGFCYLRALSRGLPSPLPRPVSLDLQDPGRIVAWLADRLREWKSICVTTYASSAARVCAAAKEKGVPLNGVCFITLGEPFTEAKKQIVGAVGAKALVRYAFTEAGIIGYLCGNPQLPDDLHFLSDCYGLIQRSRPVVDSGPIVDAFLFTSLLAASPKILLNVESGDYGNVEQRGCGCALGAVGLTTHLARIRSFEKLSSEGMTFVKTDLLRVLEEILPARFGGTSADYQVLEEEGENGILRLFLIVSPKVGPIIDEARVCRTFLEELGRDGDFKRMGAGIWERAGTVKVRRDWPVATRAGKILPFHLVKGE